MIDAVDRKDIIQELFVNSYEIRLLHSGVDLMELKQYESLKTQIEQDLMIIREVLKTSKLKDNLFRFSIAIFFFYKSANRILNYDTQSYSPSPKQKLYVDFLFLYRELYIFTVIFDSLFIVYDDTERSLLSGDFLKELEGLGNKFYQDYQIFDFIKKFYSNQVSIWREIPTMLMDKNPYTAVDDYMKQLNSIDSKFFYGIIDIFKNSIFVNGFDDRYGDLRLKILTPVELEPCSKLAIIRDYEVNSIVMKESISKIYKIMLLDFGNLGVYSNVDNITAYELLGNTYLSNPLLFVLDQFFSLYYLTCRGNETTTDNFRYYVSLLENKLGVNYEKFLEEYFLLQMERRENSILKQVEYLFSRLPSSNLHSIFKTIEMKIDFGIRDIFYAPNKEMLSGAKGVNRIELSSLTFGDSKFLIENIKSLLVKMYDGLKNRQESEAKR